jgi:hypothetical protein
LRIPGRFWNAGQERLGQHVYEREQRLLSYPQISDLPGHAVQARGDPLFRRIDATFAASELPLYCLAHERTGARESAFLRRRLDPLV